MKALLISLAIVLLVVIGSYFVYNSVENSTEYFINNLNELSVHINNKDWEKARGQYSKIEERWNEVKGKWEILIDQQDILNINMTMSKMNQFMKSKDVTLSLAELEALKKLFDFVRDNESLSLSNLL